MFAFSKVILNLRGNKNYDPSMPWIYKARNDGTIACDMFTYVDDERVTGPDEDLCWKASQRVVTQLSYSGIQSAARKRREVSNDVGAWAGSVIKTGGEKVTKEVSLEKWIKAQDQVKWLSSVINNKEGINHKELERVRGFLIYVSRTYKAMVPYLKGLHQTLDGWRDWIDKDSGWKLQMREILAVKELGDEYYSVS